MITFPTIISMIMIIVVEVSGIWLKYLLYKWYTIHPHRSHESLCVYSTREGIRFLLLCFLFWPNSWVIQVCFVIIQLTIMDLRLYCSSFRSSGDVVVMIIAIKVVIAETSKNTISLAAFRLLHWRVIENPFTISLFCAIGHFWHSRFHKNVQSLSICILHVLSNE